MFFFKEGRYSVTQRQNTKQSHFFTLSLQNTAKTQAQLVELLKSRFFFSFWQHLSPPFLCFPSTPLEGKHWRPVLLLIVA